MVRYRPKTPPKRTPTFAKRPKSKPAKRPTRVVKTLKRATPKSKPFSLVQKAWATTEAPSTAGKFNPPGWTSQQDYGTQQVKSTPVTTGFGGEKKVWHKSQSGKLGKAIAASKKQNPQAWKKATGPKPGSMNAYWSLHTDRPGTTYASRVAEMLDNNPQLANLARQESKVTQVAQTGTAVKKVKTGATTWYATNAQGQTIKGEGRLSMQARQYYGDRGYNLITSKPPGQDAQQRLSDTTGVTTFTQWGDVSTVPRDLAGQKPNKIRAEQQKLSDKYNITTYNKDGSVSTIPRQQNQLAQDGIQQVGGSKDNAWWWQSPFSASAETDKKEKPWGWW